MDEFKNLKSAYGKFAFLILDSINHKIIDVLEDVVLTDVDTTIIRRKSRNKNK